MVAIIIIVLGVAVQELQVIHIVCESRQQLCCIEAVVLCVHHLGQTGLKHILGIDIHVNLGGHALVTLGLDDQYATGSFRTIDGRSVLKDGYAFNIVHVQIGQNIVVIALMQHFAVVLHISNNTINDHQRLAVDLQARESANKHRATHCQMSAAGYGVDIST